MKEKYDGGYGVIGNIIVTHMLKQFNKRKVEDFLKKDSPTQYKEFIMQEKLREDMDI